MLRSLRFLTVVIPLALASACGDDGGNTGETPDAAPATCNQAGGEACFHPATAEIAAVSGGAAVAADLGCSAPVVTDSTADVEVTGIAQDFMSEEPLGSATVEVWSDVNFSGTPLATATSDASGNFTLTLPAGSPDRLNWRTRSEDAHDTYELNDPVDFAAANVTRVSVSRATAATILAVLGFQLDPTSGVVAGAVRDCSGNVMTHAIANVSSTSSAGGQAPTFVPGAKVFYFFNEVPVQNSVQNETNEDGLFVIVGIPQGSYFLQVWGYTDAADVAMGTAGLKLISENPVPVVPDSVVVVDMDPTQGPL